MRIAIIGTGISALSTAFYLNKKIDIDLYDSEDRLGGHTDTHLINLRNKEIRVDTGFIVCNDRNYKNFFQLINQCDVSLNESDMSYSSSIDNKTWCSKDFFKPSYYLSFFNIKFLFNILKFNKLGKKDIDDELPISEWLNLNNFSKNFAENYIYPMSAAIWSMNPNQINDFPTNRLLSFFNNHGLLDIFNRPKWYSIKNGSSSYIKKILNKTSVKNIKLSESITIKRNENKITIINNDLKTDYDYVIFTCNTKQINQILIDQTKDETDAYSYFEYLDNKVVLHNDTSLMPQDRAKWSSWNSVKKGNDQYVTYWMNNLQKLDTNENIFVTLGIFNISNSNNIFRAKKYDHIVYKKRTIIGQEKIENLQGKNRLFYAGAYLGYGFHEDGVKSGIRVAQMINALKE